MSAGLLLPMIFLFSSAPKQLPLSPARVRVAREDVWGQTLPCGRHSWVLPESPASSPPWTAAKPPPAAPWRPLLPPQLQPRVDQKFTQLLLPGLYLLHDSCQLFLSNFLLRTQHLGLLLQLQDLKSFLLLNYWVSLKFKLNVLVTYQGWF